MNVYKSRFKCLMDINILFYGLSVSFSFFANNWEAVLLSTAAGSK